MVLTQMPEPRVNLHDLRIHEAPARKGRGVPWLLLLLLVPAAFLGGFFYRGRPGAPGSGAIPVRVQALERSGSAARDTTADVSEGGWVEVPSTTRSSCRR